MPGAVQEVRGAQGEGGGEGARLAVAARWVRVYIACRVLGLHSMRLLAFVRGQPVLLLRAVAISAPQSLPLFP